jgi:hypothetical protein
MECCDVCCEKINNSNHKKVECPFCDLKACRSCSQKYLLSIPEDPHCMGCKHEHNRAFIDTYCSEQFRNRELKNHREVVLFDREMARLPETQPFVIRELQIRSMKTKYIYLVYALSRITPSTEIPERVKLPLRETIRDFILQIYADFQILNDTDLESTGENIFTQKCPGEECRGFLNDQWQCEICKQSFCEKCHEKLTFDHACDKNTIKTVKLLQRETKPCPRCNVSIYKIEGCAQMWCTQCHVAFDWRSGRIETGRIHNPHYFEFKMRGREHGDIPCGGRPSHNELLDMGVSNEILQFSRQVTMIHYDILYRYGFLYESNRVLRIEYTLNEISEIDMKRELQRRDKYNAKVNDIRDIFTMYEDTMGDLLRQCVLYRGMEQELLIEMNELTAYTNTVLIKIRRRYTCRLPCNLICHAII